MILYIKKDYDSKTMSSEGLAKKAIVLYMNEKNTSVSYDAEDFCIQRTEMGKPYLSGGPFFSISHTGNVWVCLLADYNIGIDVQIEKTNVKFEDIAKRFFNEREQGYISEKGIQGFFKVWTAREAYAKYTGEGFFGKSLKAFSLCDFLEEKNNHENVKIQFLELPQQYLAEKVCCAICIECAKELSMQGVDIDLNVDEPFAEDFRIIYI